MVAASHTRERGRRERHARTHGLITIRRIYVCFLSACLTKICRAALLPSACRPCSLVNVAAATRGSTACISHQPISQPTRKSATSQASHRPISQPVSQINHRHTGKGDKRAKKQGNSSSAVIKTRRSIVSVTYKTQPAQKPFDANNHNTRKGKARLFVYICIRAHWTFVYWRSWERVLRTHMMTGWLKRTRKHPAGSCRDTSKAHRSRDLTFGDRCLPDPATHARLHTHTEVTNGAYTHTYIPP